MAVNDTASWTEGSILFGGKELHMVTAGSTSDAAPVGIGTTMTNNVKYTVYWDRKNPAIFQTVLESAYVPTDERVVVMEVTGASAGEEVQLVSRDVQQVGNTDKLNSESFNKIVAATFSTGAMTGIVNPTYREGGVVLDSEGLKLWSDTALTSVLPQISLREETGLSFFQDNNNSFLLARLDANALTFYDGTAVAAANGDRLSQFSSTGLSFFGTDGTTTRATFSTSGLTLIGDGAVTNQPFGITIRADNNSYGNGMFQWQREDSHVVANNFVHIVGGVDYLATTVENTASDPKGLLYNVFGGETRWIKTNHVLQSAGGLAPYSTSLEWEYSADDGITTRGLRFAMTRTPAWTADTTLTLQLPVDTPAAGEVLTVSTGGVNLEWASSGVMDDWLVSADSGGSFTISDGETLDFTGGTGITSVATDGYVTFNLDADLSVDSVTVVNSVLHSTAITSGSVPTNSGAGAYGTFKYLNGSDNVLAFASGQTNATPAAATERSSFWTMLSEGDSASNRLIFEPVVTEAYSSGYHNYSYIGWHNAIYSIYADYSYASYAGASSPGFSFIGDYDTGMYRVGANILGFSTAATARWSIGTGGDFVPATDGSGGSGFDIGSTSYEVDKFYGYTIYFSNSASTTGTDLIVTAAGQIAKKSSSIQYKDNVKELVYDSSKLDKLRPVSYDYKLDNAPDIGLIAEEVDEIYPELINYDKHGKAESIKYHGLSVMLLDEVKKLRREVKELKEKN